MRTELRQPELLNPRSVDGRSLDERVELSARRWGSGCVDSCGADCPNLPARCYIPLRVRSRSLSRFVLSRFEQRPDSRVLGFLVCIRRQATTLRKITPPHHGFDECTKNPHVVRVVCDVKRLVTEIPGEIEVSCLRVLLAVWYAKSLAPRSASSRPAPNDDGTTTDEPPPPPHSVSASPISLNYGVSDVPRAHACTLCAPAPSFLKFLLYRVELRGIRTVQQQHSTPCLSCCYVSDR